MSSHVLPSLRRFARGLPMKSAPFVSAGALKLDKFCQGRCERAKFAPSNGPLQTVGVLSCSIIYHLCNNMCVRIPCLVSLLGTY